MYMYVKVLELRSEELYLKFDLPSEATFKDISGTSNRMPATKSCPSCKCVVSQLWLCLRKPLSLRMPSIGH